LKKLIVEGRGGPAVAVLIAQYTSEFGLEIPSHQIVQF
jgi:hypothetical protein